MVCPMQTFGNLETEIKEEMTNKHIIAGLIGSIGGFLIAKNYNFGTGATIGLITIGHGTGHLISNHI